MFCPNCYNYKDFELRQETETIVVRGEPIETISTITYCNHCGEKVWNDEYEDDNLLRAYSIYESLHPH